MGLFDRVSAAVSAFIGVSSTPSTAVTASTAGSAPTDERSSAAAKLAVTGAGNAPRADKQPIVLGPNLTPALVAIALRDAERGRMRRLCDLNSEMRETVPHMQAELGKREKALARCKIAVLPADTKGMGTKAEKRAKKIADYVASRVSAIEDLSDSVEHLQGGVFQGRSGCEKELFRDKNGIGIRRLIPISPKRFSYAADWRIHLWDEAGNENDARLGTFPGVDVRAEWPEKFVIHEPRTLGSEVPTRQGLGRVLVWAALFWKADVRFWVEFIELFSNPHRVGFYGKDITNKEDVDNLRQGLIELSGLTTAVFREGCQPMFLQPKETRSHREFHEVWTGEISKVVNGGTLASSMNGSSGSRAAAEVHEREGDKLTAGDGIAMDATLTRDVSRSLVRLNFGAEDAQLFTPRIHVVTEREEDLKSLGARIWSFVDHGGELAQDDVREKMTGLPAPKKGAKLLVPMSAIAPIAKSAADAANAGAKDKGDDDSSKEEDDAEEQDNEDAGADADPDKNADAKEGDADEDA